MNKTKSILTTLLSFIKRIKITKSVGIAIAATVVLCAIIICIIDFISPKNIVGIQQKKHIYLLDPSAKSLMENDYDPATFVPQIFTAPSNQAGKTVTVNYWTSGTDEKLDSAIMDSVGNYAKSLTTISEDTVFTSEVRAFKELIFLTLTSQNTAIVKTLIFDEKGEVNPEKLLRPGFEGVVIDTVKGKLSADFGVDLTVGDKLAKDALRDKTYRIASNGLIVIMPTALLPETLRNTPYYEVLVPNSIIYDYLN